MLAWVASEGPAGGALEKVMALGAVEWPARVALEEVVLAALEWPARVAMDEERACWKGTVEAGCVGSREA